MNALFRGLLAAATALSALPATAQDAAAPTPSLEDQFRDPPSSARPRVWWHWVNGNVTKDGIAKDLAWMKRVGIGGLQNFNASLRSPVVVKNRLGYASPEWKDAFRFAASEADRLGLELGVAASPGWSETGGTWVSPEDAMKKLVWSQTDVAPGRRFAGRLASLARQTGPFGTIDKVFNVNSMRDVPPAPPHGGDVAVLAFPVAVTPALVVPVVRGKDGTVIDGAALFDDNLMSAVQLRRTRGDVPALTLEYAAPQTIRSATIFMPGDAAMFAGAATLPQLEASDDGQAWRSVAAVPAASVPATVSFAPVTAKQFRVLFPAVPSDAAAPLGGPLRVGELRLSAEAKVDRFETKAAFEMAPDYSKLSQGLADTPGVDPAKVINLTGRLQADGTLDWTPPALPKGQQWRVLRLGHSLTGMTNHPAPAEAIGLEVDKYDAPAVRRYMEHYLGIYRDATGADLIGKRGLRAVVTDSIEVNTANWTPAMIAQFHKLRGYDPTPWLPALAGTIVGSRAQSDKFLFDYRRTLADLIASEHYGTVAKVAHENGLIVYGESLEDGSSIPGDDMTMRRHSDVPMAAMWTHPRSEGPHLNHVTDIRGAASTAHVYGQNLVALEALTSRSLWTDSPATLKRVIDLAFVLGVNRPVIHTSVHQPLDAAPGLPLNIFGQTFNRHEAWADLAKPWVDYLARNSLMLQQGRNLADVAYFYGEESPLTELYRKHPVADVPRANAYDFLSADALTTALSNDGADLVTTGGARYRELYLGGTSRRMTLPVLRKLAALVEDGATVIGPKPQTDPSLADKTAEFDALTGKLWSGNGITGFGKGRVIASTDVDAALGQIGVAPDFRFTGQADADIPFVHRKLAAKDGGGDSYFLVNRKDRAEVIEARFRVTGKAPELWHAETGTAEAVSYRIENGETIVPLTLAPDESVHVVFRKAAQAPALAIKKLAPVEIGKVTGPWQVAFQPGRGAPPSVTFPTLAPLNENADAGIKYFSGVATYSSSFTAPKGWKAGQPLWLDLGEVGELAEVAVNGKSVGSAWHAPYRVDIGAAAKPGRNTVQVRVANLWVNRLVGDKQPGATPVAGTPANPYPASTPLRRSGLIGPVTLMGQAR
ncbi:MAG: glycosyl hydrolase [Novosphingobium sp.]